MPVAGEISGACSMILEHAPYGRRGRHYHRALERLNLYLPFDGDRKRLRQVVYLKKVRPDLDRIAVRKRSLVYKLSVERGPVGF